MAGASRAKAARLMSRWLGVRLSLNRIGFGLTYLLHPARGGRAWIGRAAGDPATTVIHARARSPRLRRALSAWALRCAGPGPGSAPRFSPTRRTSPPRSPCASDCRRAERALPCWSLASLRSTGTSTPRSSTPPDHAAHQVRARRRGDRPLGPCAPGLVVFTQPGWAKTSPGSRGLPVAEHRYQRGVIRQPFFAPVVAIFAALDLQSRHEQVVEAIAASPARPPPADLATLISVEHSESVAEAAAFATH